MKEITPPMGWNSWNTFTDKIDEKLVIETADALSHNGLAEAGYKYVIIDDCWAEKERDKNGMLAADKQKFPHGMKYVADYVHSKGLKFGMYSCCGTRTCANYPGSFGHEWEDAKQFASWGVDYLKYDNCFKPNCADDPLLYRRMGLALANCGRDIVFAACQWGTENVSDWISTTGAATYRSTGDIKDCWSSVLGIANSQIEALSATPNCFNDMDMLVVGMHGNGGNGYIAAGGSTDTEYETHFALWAMMASPLIIGADVRHLDEVSRCILTNSEVIAIDQDEGRYAPYVLRCASNLHNTFTLVRLLSDGSAALGMFNFNDTAALVSVNFFDVGLSVRGMSMRVRDALHHEDLGVRRELLSATIEPHGSAVYRCTAVND